MSQQLVIIGASAAGIAAANTIAQLDSVATITCIDAQKTVPYNTCFLVDILAGAKNESQIVLAQHWLKHSRNRLIHDTVTRIDVQNKMLECQNGRVISYDALLLAVGASPSRLYNNNCNGIFYFHTLAEIQAINHYIKEHAVKECVIIGAGLTGIECANAMHKKGIRCTIIDHQERIMPTLLHEKAADFLQERIQVAGHTIVCAKHIIHINQVQTKFSLSLSDGTVIDTQMIICAIGVTPNIVLAQQTGMSVSPQGTLVNEYMQTNQPDIYAAGDAIAIKNLFTKQIQRSCTWADAMIQGIHAAHAMVANPKAYKGAAIALHSHFFGLDFVYAGQAMAKIADDDTVHIDQTTDYSHSFVRHAEKLRGYTLLGEAQKHMQFKALLLKDSV